MFPKLVLNRVFTAVTTPTLLTAAVLASSEKEAKKELIRPKDLSIYRTPTKNEELIIRIEETKAESQLMFAVRQVREGMQAVSDQLGQVTDRVNHTIEIGKAHTSTAIQTLREEDNYLQRYGVIALGGAIGYVLAVRRGKVRRLLNTATGSTIVAAICYPEQTRELTSDAFKHFKRYIIISYHFLNGVLRDYVGVQLPNLPGPLSIGSTSAAERDASTVPTSAALMPPPTATPSHIPLPAPILMPPIDLPSYFPDPTDAKKNQG